MATAQPAWKKSVVCRGPRLAGLHGAVALIGLSALITVLRAADPGLSEAPFAARSAPAGRTLFTALSPEATGIKAMNHYGDPQMWGKHYTELMNGSLGTGVAVADFDRDGRPDVFVVSKTGPGRLFRNLGDWKFADVTVTAGLAAPADLLRTDRPEWTQGAAWADVNNDGWLDLYVCRFAAPNLLYISRGDGTFQEEAQRRGLAVTDASGLGTFFDYDRDGWLDVYVQTNLLDTVKAPNGQRDYLFHNRGDGTFEDVTVRAGITDENLAHGTAVWDHDGDGWPDLYVANDFTAPDKLYRNNRDGTFTDVIHRVVPVMPYSSMGADQGDLNNDGRPDLLVADMAATSHEKDHRGMAYSRTLKTGTPEPAAGEALQTSRNTLFLNTGTGRVLEAAHLAGLDATDWTWSVRFEDLDNDGRVDLHVTNGMIREYQNVDLLDRMVMAETFPERVGLMRGSPKLAEANLAYRNLGDLRFEEVGAAWGLNQTGVSFGAAYGDFDGDGDLDVIYANHEDHPTVLRNDSPTGHRLVIALRGTVSNRYGVGGTVRIETATGSQVRTLTLARGYLSSSEPILHFGLGEETIITRLTVEWPSGHTQRFTDIRAERKLTITEPAGLARPAAPPVASPTQFTAVKAATGLDLKAEESFDQESQPLVPVRFDRLGPALALGDLNQDGQTDLVLGGTGRSPAQIVLRAAERFATAGNLPASPVDDGPLLLLDADGDGLPDLLQTKAGVNRAANSPYFQPVLHHNSGAGFTPVPDALPTLPLSVGAAVAADFDRDGRLDVFLGGRVLPGRYPQPPRSALLRNTGGRFEDVTDTLAPALREAGLVRSALWSDVDGDGWVDLLLALEWGGVRYFRNDAGRGFSDQSAAAGFAAAGDGAWTSLAAADFNGDGRLDYAAGNTGLNTLTQPPALIFLGNFKGGNALQLVEAYQEGDKLYPRRTRKELGGQIPAILQRFPRNDPYARATLPDLLGADRLAAARRFAATELQSGVFLSQPGGSYRFSPLPRIAQIAPIQGMVAGDFDGDGLADLYAVQNSFAPNPGVGRFDGGLSQLLRGDGRGTFTAVEPAQSGLVVPGDAKALVVLDLDADGWPDFLLSRNNATTLAWRNEGIPGRHSFQVRLRGRPGNATAIGARLQLALTDGTTQFAEISAGGGYYSQSDTGAFFGWSQGNPPRRLTVRWPDGTISEQALTELPGARLDVAAP
ncbi:FG-GAP repeat protein [Lacunisphaera limnophila]|uniref:FG-GAP repeat protein n=1 Tax=Lacunisphaera limnophila TaxID=1838286 RepID=A0A1D8ARU1_9BACT|nr:FG-GAP-like repeat-containing protein [Lacunisphaera limnophila]AOS43596.1 FG-GAP repeat protein [Lacunisphaera limnophila]